MAQYSISKINAFDNCRLQYKYKYLDRLVSDITTIERFMGQRVHEALEEFYQFIQQGKIQPMDWLISRYGDGWEKNYSDSVKVVRDGLCPEDYLKRGELNLSQYYEKYQPFNQAKVLSCEKKIFFTLKRNGEEYPFNGVLDRLDFDDKNNIFEIHDYKTGSNLISQSEADEDWQLGLYHIAIKKKWPDAAKIKLVWHFLSANKEIVSFRTEDQIKDLTGKVFTKISQIETCRDFPGQKSGLCGWCDFQNICPLWRHPKEMEKLEPEEYKQNPGVQMVAAYKKLEEEKNELKEEIKRLEEEQEKIVKEAVKFAKENNILVIDGPDAQLEVNIKEEEKAPTRAENTAKWEGLRDALIETGKYQEVSTVNNNMLNFRLKIWPKEIIEKIRQFLVKKTSQTVKLIKK